MQHHPLLHRSVPRTHHRQRHHPAEGKSGRPLLRSTDVADEKAQAKTAGNGVTTAATAASRSPEA
jgi:hypothetical protein